MHFSHSPNRRELGIGHVLHSNLKQKDKHIFNQSFLFITLGLNSLFKIFINTNKDNCIMCEEKVLMIMSRIFTINSQLPLFYDLGTRSLCSME